MSFEPEVSLETELWDDVWSQSAFQSSTGGKENLCSCLHRLRSSTCLHAAQSSSMYASVRAPVPGVKSYWHNKGMFIRGGDESVVCDDNLIELSAYRDRKGVVRGVGGIDSNIGVRLSTRVGCLCQRPLPGSQVTPRCHHPRLKTFSTARHRFPNQKKCNLLTKTQDTFTKLCTD